MGNFGKIYYFDFSRKEIEKFFLIFPRLLNNLNLEKTQFFFEESHPLESIGSEKHVIDKDYSGVEYTENNQFDMEIIFLQDVIKIIIRNDESPRDEIIDEIMKISNGIEK